MRGLRLFVRPIESGDSSDVRAFLERNDRLRGGPAYGLLGKLLGEIVVVAELEMTSDALRVNEIVVARELRRKWIGKVMMREVEQLAKKLDRDRLIVDDARDAPEFFRRVGFEHEGDRWVRVLGS